MSRSRPVRRRGVAAVAMIVVMLVVDLIIVGMVIGSGRDQDLTARRLETIQAFYATEAGMNMAIREMMEGADEDGDGAAGTVSDDSDDNTDPSIGIGRVVVTSVTAGSQTTLTSDGRSGQARRRARAVVE